jgi:hypothetical protein
MRKAFSFLCMLPFVMLACSKEPEEEEYTLDPAGMQYIQLRQGQYFIYRDSATGSTDSVVVSESSLATERFSESLWGSKPGWARRQVYGLALQRKNGGDSTWLKGTATADYLPYVILEDERGRYFSYPGDCLFGNDVERLASLMVEGKMYTDVMVFHRRDFSDFNHAYYWAPSNGLVQVVKQDWTSPVFKRWKYTLLRHG